jgi:hypothetical protein
VEWQCDCGNKLIKQVFRVTSGIVKSCGECHNLVCIKCDETKKLEEFVFHKAKKSYRNICLKCNSKYGVSKNREIRKRNGSFIQNIKNNSECAICKKKFHFCQLDFNHLDPSTKDYALHSSTTRSIESLENEINKCNILVPIVIEKRHTRLMAV